MARIRPFDQLLERRCNSIDNFKRLLAILFLRLLVLLLNIRGECPLHVFLLRIRDEFVKLLPKLDIAHIFLDIAKLLELRNIDAHVVFSYGKFVGLIEHFHGCSPSPRILDRSSYQVMGSFYSHLHLYNI